VDIFRETTSAIRECYHLKFLHTLEIQQGYTAHTTTGTVPQKNFCKNLKFGPKIERVRPYKFAASGISLTKLFQTTCCEGGVIMWVPFFESQPPEIWEGQKTSKFRRDFSELSTLIANISGTDLHVEHLKKT